MKTKSTLITFLIVLTSTISLAQPGTLDGDFDADGIAVTGFDNHTGIGRSVVVQPDGKIVVAGQLIVNVNFSDFGIVRYNIDGSLDNSFGTDGKVITDFGNNDRAYSLVIQPDGKIIVAGMSNAVTGIKSFAIARYGTDGTLDTSFDTDGMLLGPFGDGRSVAIQADGKILVAGNSLDSQPQFLVARYNEDGTLDNSFGNNGMVSTPIGNESASANSIAIQADGKILVAGASNNGLNDDVAVVRYNADGTLDNSFSVNGMVTTAIGNKDDIGLSVVSQPDGKIAVFAYKELDFNESECAVVRYNSDGSLDISFSVNGKASFSFGSGSFFNDRGSIALQADGSLVVAGTAFPNNSGHHIALARLKTDGNLDTSFNSTGKVLTRILNDATMGSGCTVQQDGKIIVAGVANCAPCFDNHGFAVLRYISGSDLGVISFSKQDHGLLIYPNPIQDNAVIEYTLTDNETISIDMFDISGRLLQSFVKAEKRIKGTHKETLDLDASIPSGSYILTFSNGAGSSSVRVVK